MFVTQNSVIERAAQPCLMRSVKQRKKQSLFIFASGKINVTFERNDTFSQSASLVGTKHIHAA